MNHNAFGAETPQTIFISKLWNLNRITQFSFTSAACRIRCHLLSEQKQKLLTIPHYLYCVWYDSFHHPLWTIPDDKNDNNKSPSRRHNKTKRTTYLCAAPLLQQYSFSLCARLKCNFTTRPRNCSLSNCVSHTPSHSVTRRRIWKILKTEKKKQMECNRTNWNWILETEARQILRANATFPLSAIDANYTNRLYEKL